MAVALTFWWFNTTLFIHRLWSGAFGLIAGYPARTLLCKYYSSHRLHKRLESHHLGIKIFRSCAILLQPHQLITESVYHCLETEWIIATKTWAVSLILWMRERKEASPVEKPERCVQLHSDIVKALFELFQLSLSSHPFYPLLYYSYIQHQ
jgi:hypothetical protein